MASLRGQRTLRGPSGAGSPAHVHRGERERHTLEQQDHEEPLTGRAVSHALTVLACLWWVELRGVRSGQGADPGILPPGWVGPGLPLPRDWSDARALARSGKASASGR